MKSKCIFCFQIWPVWDIHNRSLCAGFSLSPLLKLQIPCLLESICSCICIMVHPINWYSFLDRFSRTSAMEIFPYMTEFTAKLHIIIVTSTFITVSECYFMSNRIFLLLTNLLEDATLKLPFSLISYSSLVMSKLCNWLQLLCTVKHAYFNYLLNVLYSLSYCTCNWIHIVQWAFGLECSVKIVWICYQCSMCTFVSPPPFPLPTPFSPEWICFAV